MQPLHIFCTHCRAEINCPRKFVGRTVKCPKCGKPFRVVEPLDMDEDPFGIERPLLPEERGPQPASGPRVGRRSKPETPAQRAVGIAIITMFVALFSAALLSQVVDSFSADSGAQSPWFFARISSILLFTILGGGVVVLYFFPVLVAVSRQHPNALPIGIVNLFFGWSLLGWVGCLAWACMAVERPESH